MARSNSANTSVFWKITRNAGVSENDAADIFGHEKPRITYALYSGDASPETKRAALARLQEPPRAR